MGLWENEIQARFDTFDGRVADRDEYTSLFGTLSHRSVLKSYGHDLVGRQTRRITWDCDRVAARSCEDCTTPECVDDVEDTHTVEVAY